MSASLAAWLSAFAFTQLVEVPIYRRLLDVSLAEAFVASLLTHPVVFIVFPRLFANATYVTGYAAAELFAWLVEGVYFVAVLTRPSRARGGSRVPSFAPSFVPSFTASFVANASSVALAETSRYFFGRP